MGTLKPRYILRGKKKIGDLFEEKHHQNKLHLLFMAGLQAHVPVISNRHEHKQNQGCYKIVHTHNLVWRMVKVLL